MKLSEALSIIRRHGRGIAVCQNGRDEHHVQYSYDRYLRLTWQAGSTAGGVVTGSLIPDMNSEGWQVFASLYSQTQLS
jgi:hypothetical protein